MHGISVILKFISQILPYFSKDDYIVEIGSTRDTGSTGIFARICANHGLKFITVDPSSSSYADANKVLAKYDQTKQRRFIAVNAKGEEAFKTFKPSHPCIILAYLDGFDIVTDHPHKQSTIDAYTANGIDLLKDGNRISAEVHLETTRDLEPHIKPNGFICFDDTWYQPDTSTWHGKGATAVPWLLNELSYSLVTSGHSLEKTPKYNHGVLLQKCQNAVKFQ
jgi:hypothetical protein